LRHVVDLRLPAAIAAKYRDPGSRATSRSYRRFSIKAIDESICGVAPRIEAIRRVDDHTRGHHDDKTLEQFDQAMRGIYDAALKLKPPYRAAYFLRMVSEHGGKATVDRLLATNKPSEGFTELFL